MKTINISSDTEHFLETLLFCTDGENENESKGWTIYEFHPDFIQAVESFCDGFREYLEEKNQEAIEKDLPEPFEDPDSGERSFGGNCYASLSGHGIGFFDDRDSTYGDAMQAAIKAYSGEDYRFEDIGDLAKFNGKIHLAFRTAAFRKEYLGKMFAVEKSKDGRYSNSLEWTGKETQQHVARFCGEWIGSAATKQGAEALCANHHNERVNP